MRSEVSRQRRLCFLCPHWPHQDRISAWRLPSLESEKKRDDKATSSKKTMKGADENVTCNMLCWVMNYRHELIWRYNVDCIYHYITTYLWSHQMLIATIRPLYKYIISKAGIWVDLSVHLCKTSNILLSANIVLTLDFHSIEDWGV